MSGLPLCFYNAGRIFHEQFIHEKLNKELGVAMETFVSGLMRNNTAMTFFSSEKPLIRCRKEKV